MSERRKPWYGRGTGALWLFFYVCVSVDMVVHCCSVESGVCVVYELVGEFAFLVFSFFMFLGVMCMYCPRLF